MLGLIFPIFHAGRAGTALLILRAFIGIAFLFHGYGKIADLAGFAAEFDIPLRLASAAAYTQFVCGLLMIVGLLTPPAALALATTMAVATFELISRGEPFVSPHGHSWEAASLYLVAASAVALLGPGRLSLDAILFGRKPVGVDGGRASAPV